MSARTFRNSDVETRRWDLPHPDGGTVQLAPDETVELDLPDDFEDPWLVPVGDTASKARRRTAPDETPATAPVNASPVDGAKENAQ